MDIIIEKTLELLKEQNKTQKELSEFLKISPNAFTNWKSGLNTSYKKYVYAIAKYFNVSVEYLMGETDEKNKPLINNDEELTEYLEELKNRDEMRMLFSVSKGCTKAEVEQAVRIIEALRKKEDDDGC